jgi:hypothetical protein
MVYSLSLDRDGYCCDERCAACEKRAKQILPILQEAIVEAAEQALASVLALKSERPV